MAKKTKPKIDSVISEKDLRKRYPSSLTAIDIDDDDLWIPSTCLAVNYVTGGGIPYGKVLEIFGEENSGKTLMANNFAYAAQQLGGVVLWNDAEQSFTKSWALANNLDLSKIELFPDTRVEQLSDWAADMSIYWRSKLTNNEPILLIQDSMAALDCMENINSKMVDSKADMGNRAKAIYKMFRIRNELLKSLGICQIYVNQLRKNLKAGLFENPDTTPGGNALKYYASIRLGCYGSKDLKIKSKGKERKIGKLTTIRVIKNKVAPPRNSIKKIPMYNNPKYCDYIGFDRYYGLAEVLLEEGVVTKSAGGVYSYKGKTLIRGEEKFDGLIAEDDDLRSKFIRKLGINTISRTRKKLEKYNGTNLFEVTSGTTYKKQIEEDDSEEDEG